MVVTAFGPFGRFDPNPSEILARHVFGKMVVTLPVSFSAVDDFIGHFPSDEKRLLMLGVSAGSKNIRIEQVASDCIGELADIEGCVRTGAVGDLLRGELLADIAACHLWDTSTDAGNYLCNYLFFQALSKLPQVKSAFVHVPPFIAMPLQIQSMRLRRLIAKAQLTS